jgi:CLIP-associating protein 1/2
MEKSYLDAPSKDTGYKDLHYSSIPNFQRPLLRKHGPGRSAGSNRLSFEDNQLPTGEMFNYMDGLMSLNDALTEGLSVSADWFARVVAFNYLRKTLQQGPKGVQDITQSFEKVMKLFFQHLDDPHHKVAQAALSTLAELIPACRKPFEGFLERILPHVFSRLVDPKELIRQLCSSTLEIVSNTYSIDLVLPALLRSLDEQCSPKAKVVVIEFVISSFTKLGMNGETSSGSGLLKLWLAKLAPLENDKNTKLKETTVTAIISVYSYFDSTSVLNFILGLTIEEQSTLRRSLK